MSDDQNTGDDKRDPQTHALLGAAFEVHRILGCGFLEPVYGQAFIVELVLRQIPVEIEPVIGVRYKTERLAAVFRPDLVCFGSVIVEIKALAALTPVHQAQTINYLKATGFERALLINFGAPRLEYRRVIFSAAYRRSIATDPTP